MSDECADLDCDKVKFFTVAGMGLYFRFPENSTDNARMFYLLLSRAYTVSRPFPHLTPSHQPS